MTAKHKLVVAACALTFLGIGVANAGPCNTGQTTGAASADTREQATNKASQQAQREEHAQPSVAEQPKSTTPTQSSAAEQSQSTVSSGKMTDRDQSPGAPSQGSEPSAKMADQGC
ncbi:MAG: hypothetical protein JWP25_8295 [Bradyrhizobium sp.]|jgi:hypothetical protein|nr:hypothetical protein [Bradyrhizobium sp.]